jgi:hypothetical protein
MDTIKEERNGEVEGNLQAKTAGVAERPWSAEEEPKID